MPEKNSSPKHNIVSSIFGRSKKPKLSSLFVSKKHKAQSPQPRAQSPQPKAQSPQPKAALLKKHPFGLDITENSVKIVELATDVSGAIIVSSIVAEDLPADLRGSRADKLQPLAEFLKKIRKEKGLGPDCFTAVPSHIAKLEFIKLPKMPASEIEPALQWEIKQSRAADMNEIVLDYVELKNQGIMLSGNQTGILAISAPKKDMFEHLALIEAAGLNSLAVDAEPLADLAALSFKKKGDLEEVIVFLDFGAAKTSLNIIHRNELLYTRALNISGNSLTTAISEYCNVAWDEAESLKKKFGIALANTEALNLPPNEQSSQVKNAIFPLLENMVQDIDHTFKYFSFQVSQSQIKTYNKIVLSGGASCLNGLIPFLKGRLFGDVAVINDPEPNLNVAYGLALRGAGK